MAHTCHATKCKAAVVAAMWGCKKHWFMVPSAIRKRIWAAYRVGQCDDMNPSREYCLAAKEAVIAVAKKEGIEPDTRLYDSFLGGTGIYTEVCICSNCGEVDGRHQEDIDIENDKIYAWLACAKCGRAVEVKKSPEGHVVVRELSKEELADDLADDTGEDL